MTKRELETIRVLKAENAALKECLEARDNRLQVAARDTARAVLFARAVCAMAEASEALVIGGFNDHAERLLGIVRSVQIDWMCAKVSREPGGIHHESEQNLKETTR